MVRRRREGLEVSCATHGPIRHQLSPRSTVKDATEYFSRADADLSHVLRTYDRIDDHFKNVIGNSKINPAIRSAVICANATLNLYYSRTDASVMCRIATSNYL